MTDDEAERKLVTYARKAMLHAELAATRDKHLDKVSADALRNARQDVCEAIAFLQGLEKALTKRMFGEPK
jgi:hypothetical protein